MVFGLHISGCRKLSIPICLGWALDQYAQLKGDSMKTIITNIVKQNKNIVRIALVVGLILLVPLVLTMRDGGIEGVGWNWKPGDFIVMGVLLFGTGLTLDFAWRKITNHVYRVFAVIAIVITFLLVWVELAVDGVSQVLRFFF